MSASRSSVSSPHTLVPLGRSWTNGPPLRAQGDVVTSVTFSPNDPRIMSTAGEDKTVQVWDLTQRDRPVPLGPALEGHEKAVNSVAIGPNGIMATASEDQ